MKCLECGYESENEITVCPQCGYEINLQEKNENKDIPVYKNKRYIGICLYAVACICFIIAFTRINNDDYSFYKAHYKECMEGYADTKSTANSYSSSFFKGSYNYIATEYEKMAKDDKEKIWEYRIQAMILCAGGIICITIGYKQHKRGNDNGISKMS